MAHLSESIVFVVIEHFMHSRRQSIVISGSAFTSLDEVR